MFKISLQGLKSRCQLVWFLLETLEGGSVHFLTSRDIRHSLAAGCLIAVSASVVPSPSPVVIKPSSHQDT